MNPETTKSIETAEIRGLTLKNIFTLIACTGTIVISVMASFFALKTEIRELRIKKDNDNVIYDIRLQNLDQKTNDVKRVSDDNSVQIRAMRFELEEIKYSLKNQKK